MTTHLSDPAPPDVKLAVTTSSSPASDLVDKGERLAAELGARFVARGDESLDSLFRVADVERMIVVESRRLVLRGRDGAEYSYHPNMVLVRAFNLARGARDLFADATGLAAGDSILDCTVGFAAEATLASLLVGTAGRVVGLEAAADLAALTRDGVARFVLRTASIQEALRRIEIVTAEHGEYLRASANAAFDVVYFDPFFEERLPGSEHSVSPLHHFGHRQPLAEMSVREAIRVARRRVVVKHPKREPLPEGLQRLVTREVSSRKSRVVYAVIDVA